MARFYTGTLCAVVLGLLVGCGGAKPKQVGDYEPSEPSAEPTSDTEPSGAVSHSDGDSSGSDRPAPKRKPKSQSTADDDYEITPADCQALSDQYRDVLRKSELEKLAAKKLPEKMLPKAQADVEKTVEQGTERWLTACKGIINSPQKRSRLTCALAAKELQRFEDCWQGKVEDEPSAGQP